MTDYEIIALWLLCYVPIMLMWRGAMWLWDEYQERKHKP